VASAFYVVEHRFVLLSCLVSPVGVVFLLDEALVTLLSLFEEPLKLPSELLHDVVEPAQGLWVGSGFLGRSEPEGWRECLPVFGVGPGFSWYACSFG